MNGRVDHTGVLCVNDNVADLHNHEHDTLNKYQREYKLDG